MATVKQIQYRLGQAKRKLAKLNRTVASAKYNVKKLEGQLKNARPAAKKRPKKKAAKKKAAPKRKKAAKKKAGWATGSKDLLFNREELTFDDI